MSFLAKLKAAKSLNDLAEVLGYKPSSLSYLLYKQPVSLKYSVFAIAKKSGGVRTICAPAPAMKRLQRRLADVLQSCISEIEAGKGPSRSLAHGFRKGHSIVTNARQHKSRRYVLNLDIEDFFPSFNFGRVRGFFIKNNDFKLHERVATVLAQIACHDNCLPQGSPCSPILSNLIAHILGSELINCAAAARQS